MKLVDILAKGLKSWPEGLECLSQLKGTGYIINGKGFDGRAFDALQIADETLVAGAIVTRAEWQAAVDALNAPKVVEWDGEGLPPVGSTCEHSTDDNKNDSADGGWKKVKIVGHHQFHNDDYLCAVWVSGTDVSYSSEGEHFRPIRTAEQVAAEEIEAIREFLIYEHCDGGLIGIAKALHESGYRKEPKPCGS